MKEEPEYIYIYRVYDIVDESCRLVNLVRSRQYFIIPLLQILDENGKRTTFHGQS